MLSERHGSLYILEALIYNIVAHFEGKGVHMIYLDNAATTKLSLEVKSAMIDAMDNYFGNPSSLHGLGVDAERVIKACRKTIAKSLCAHDQEIYFTSGGTEANNLAILGSVPIHAKKIITSAFEHKSVLECFKTFEKSGIEVVYLKPDADGRISIENVESALDEDVALISIMGINNETGAFQDIEAIGKSIRHKAPKAIFHVDWIQGYMKYPMDVERFKVDLLSISAHKIKGPKGIGALYVRKSINIRPRQLGGGQERGLRPGTENFIGIVGFAEAVKTFKMDRNKLKVMNDRIFTDIQLGYTEAVRISPLGDHCSPAILNISFPGLKGEVLLHMLESKSVYVSTGSACNAKVKVYSHVLESMGLDEATKMGALRLSLSDDISEEELETAVRIIVESAMDLKRMMR